MVGLRERYSVQAMTSWQSIRGHLTVGSSAAVGSRIWMKNHVSMSQSQASRYITLAAWL